MNFRREIKKVIEYCNNAVDIYTGNEKFKGYAVFNKIKRKEGQYYNTFGPNELGINNSLIYNVWIVSDDEFKTIDYIVYGAEKYIKLYDKYRDETGCFEVIMSKEEDVV